MTGEHAMPNATTTPQSPNDILASGIVDTLIVAGLIKEAHRGPLLAKLKSNGVKQEDWNLWIDMATSPQAAVGGQQ